MDPALTGVRVKVDTGVGRVPRSLRIVDYVRSSLWLIPLLCLAAGVGCRDTLRS